MAAGSLGGMANEKKKKKTAAVQTLIRAQPLCLWECKAFTSEAALRMHLNTHDDCIIPKHIAKDYELTRVSLVEL